MVQGSNTLCIGPLYNVNKVMKNGGVLNLTCWSCVGERGSPLDGGCSSSVNIRLITFPIPDIDRHLLTPLRGSNLINVLEDYTLAFTTPRHSSYIRYLYFFQEVSVVDFLGKMYFFCHTEVRLNNFFCLLCEGLMFDKGECFLWYCLHDIIEIL